MASTLAKYLAELRDVPKETPIQPELKHARQEQDKAIREEQDLQAGAILEGLVHDGEGEDTPKPEDLLYVHYTVRNDEDDVLYSTMTADGGSGYPLAFRLEKGQRVPRGWEIALKGMTKGCRKVLKIKAGYAYNHPDCKLPPPDGVAKDKPYAFDLHLLSWYQGFNDYGADANIYKHCLREGHGWENPRPPFEVTFSCEARTLAYNGVQQSGYVFFQTKPDSPMTATLGSGQLPEGLETALGYLSKGEKALFILPSTSMTKLSDYAQSKGVTPSFLTPSPPSKANQVELVIHLISQVQMRDMTGTGEVMKKRLTDGKGEFPMDCPLHDAAVRVHYKARHKGEGEGSWLFDSRGGDDNAAPLEFDTGCGEHPEGLEMCIKLMVPEEVSSVYCAPKFAYLDRSDVPAGMDPNKEIEFEVELVSFERDGHWQQLELGERIKLAEKMKAKGNQLFQQKKFQFAANRYDRLHRLLQSIRDFETEEEVATVDALKLAAMSNLGLCQQSLTHYSEAIDWYNKVLEMDPDNAKAMFRRGKAKSLKGDFDEAEEDLQAALDLDPTISAEVQTTLQQSSARRKAANIKQKQELRNFFNR